MRAAKAKLMQSRLEQENMNEQMMLELTHAANNLDEARLESELSDRSLLQAAENMKVSKSQYEVGLAVSYTHLSAPVFRKWKSIVRQPTISGETGLMATTARSTSIREKTIL